VEWPGRINVSEFDKIVLKFGALYVFPVINKNLSISTKKKDFVKDEKKLINTDLGFILPNKTKIYQMFYILTKFLYQIWCIWLCIFYKNVIALIINTSKNYENHRKHDINLNLKIMQL